MIVIIGGFCASQPVDARDRPGTPDQEALSLCGYDQVSHLPLICGSFNNTATETVRIEMEMTRNGAPFAYDPAGVCARLVGLTPCPAGGFLPGRGRYNAMLVSGDFGTQYCARFRARRVSDQVVSERWSNYACAQTPPQPPASTAAPLPLPARTDSSSSLGAKFGAQASKALLQPRLMMPGVDLPGNDYSSKPITGTAIDCQTACSLDGKCAAWTWVKPGVQNTQAMCWLKSSIPAQTTNVNTTSGIKNGTGGG